MAISRHEVERIAHLARLELSEAEGEQMAHDLGQILGYVEKLREVDISSVEPTIHPVPLPALLREDQPRPSLPAVVVMENVPDREDDLVKVPRIVE